ncbi:Latrophilin-3 [Toxocara canis]|uniref:Latrophilin-3 n=1 Tax=Toxocara canis TaxID=6265 RepID=A0A0B2V252_TOXCA|nr:Latrophilin-3 [Toxocara canis]
MILAVFGFYNLILLLSLILKYSCSEQFVFDSESANKTRSLQDSSDSTEQSFCEEQEWDGLRFPRTPACQQVTLPCPNPETTIGVVIQRCSCDTAEWLSRPDTNNCAHKWISELSEAIQNNVPAENISRTFSTNLKQTLQTGIYGGDITGSVDIGEELLPLARRQYSLLLDRGERSAKATTFTEVPASFTFLQDSSDSTEQSFCEEQEWDGLRFPRTPACQQVTLPCPNPETTIGVVIQRCSCDTAEWLSRPDTNNCAHKWISELSEAIQNNVPAENISRTFSTNLKQTLQTGIYGGDITGSVDIGEELLPLARRQYSLLLDRGERSAKATTFTEEFGEAGDELLGPVAESVWMQLDPTVRIDKASVLMSLLEQSAIMMADFIYAKQKKMGFDNWALEVQVKRPHVYVADDVPDGPVVKSGRMRENSIEQAVGDTLDEAIRPSAFSLSAAPRTRMGSLNRNPMRLGYYVFKSVGPLLTPQGNKIINSLVIGASINNPNQSLQLPPNNPVTFTFYHIHTTDVANPQCVFWDTMARVWSDRGCTMLRTSDESTDCSCDHLTSFAILMDVTGKLDITLGPESAAALNIITIVGCVLSIICLLLSFLVFTCFRSLWNVRNTIHRNLCLCLLIAELTFVVGIDRTENKAVCASIAVILHYFFLASFCWMLLEGYQLYLMLIQVFEPDNVKILLYFLWAYGFPAIIVAVSAGVAWPSYGTPNYCWINVDTPTIWAFVGPITVVIIANIVFLAVALKVVMSVKSRDRTRVERMAGWLKGSGTLLCLLGVTWIFGYAMIVSKAEAVFAYIFTILNCIQGVFIFVLHVLLNEKVRATLFRFARTRLCCAKESGAAYNSRSYLSSRQKILNMIKGSESSNNSDGGNRSSEGSGINGLHKTKLEQKQPLGEYDGNLQRKPTPPPIYLEFREKFHEDAPNTAESTLESESPKPGEKHEHFSHFIGQKQSESRRSAAPVRRKKFPLGTSEEERGSQFAKQNVIVERL